MQAGDLRHVVVSQSGDRSLLTRSGFVKELELRRLILSAPELLGPLGPDLRFVRLDGRCRWGRDAWTSCSLTPDGTLTLVESKLEANDECRREVVGQVLEYAAYASDWTLDDVRQTAGSSWSPSTRQVTYPGRASRRHSPSGSAGWTMRRMSA